MHLLTPEDFQPWLGRKVRINTEPRAAEVVLERIDRRRVLPGIDQREPFTLVFTATRDTYLLDMAYEFDCGKGGPHSIFISQMQPSADRRHYQAVFG